MIEKKKPPVADFNTDILLADAMLRLTALEKLLIQKGIITKSELNDLTAVLVENVTKVILDKVQSSKDLNDFVASLTNEVKKDKN
jgi:hypothetical protein